MSAVSERISAEHAAFVAWRPPAGLEWAEQQYAAADRRGMALGRLVGQLLAYVRMDLPLTPEAVAEVVEYALHVPEEQLVYGLTHEPKPLPIDEPRRVALSAGGLG